MSAEGLLPVAGSEAGTKCPSFNQIETATADHFVEPASTSKPCPEAYGCQIKPEQKLCSAMGYWGIASFS